MDQEVMPHIRKAVTGDREMKIRDFRKTPPVVRFVDKFSFFFGVTTFMITEMVFLKRPDLLWVVFLVLCPMLIAVRIPMYYVEKFHFFTLDFCYFVNGLYVFCIATHFIEQYTSWTQDDADHARWLHEFNHGLLRLNFVLTTGPLNSAIWVWKNSMVFHSLDKMTSLFIHLIPALLAFCQRWYATDDISSEESTSLTFAMCEKDECVLSTTEWITYPMMAYIFWQVIYLAITEVLLVKYIERDQDIQTSLRWLSADRKNAFNRLTKAFCRKINIMVSTTSDSISLHTTTCQHSVLTTNVFLRSNRDPRRSSMEIR